MCDDNTNSGPTFFSSFLPWEKKRKKQKMKVIFGLVAFSLVKEEEEEKLGSALYASLQLN
jgi:hypothetical protein